MLTVGGANGPVQLTRATAAVTLALEGEDGEEAGFGDECRPYVGDLPGLAALGGLGAGAGPAVVLGTDTLRRRPGLWWTKSCVYV